MGSNLQKSRVSKIQKILDIRVFYMSSISVMGPHFFHWKNKLWVRGGRSRLALSENIEKNQAVYDRFMPSKPANLRDPYKIRFSIFFEKSKNVVNHMIWRCREFVVSKIFVFFYLSRKTRWNSQVFLFSLGFAMFFIQILKMFQFRKTWFNLV